MLSLVSAQEQVCWQVTASVGLWAELLPKTPMYLEEMVEMEVEGMIPMYLEEMGEVEVEGPIPMEVEGLLLSALEQVAPVELE